MKSKAQKYEEAVDRNLGAFQKALSSLQPSYEESISKYNLGSFKTYLGIRKTDTSHDKEVGTILTDIQTKVEGRAKKAEKQKAKG